MKIRFLKLKDWLLMCAMGLFGLTACHTAKKVAEEPVKNDDKDTVEQPVPRGGEMALMYGVPTMDFVVKGRVINEQGKRRRQQDYVSQNPKTELHNRLAVLLVGVIVPRDEAPCGYLVAVEEDEKLSRSASDALIFSLTYPCA